MEGSGGKQPKAEEEGWREKEMSQERRDLETPEKICISHVCAHAHLYSYACVYLCTLIWLCTGILNYAKAHTHTHVLVHK